MGNSTITVESPPWENGKNSNIMTDAPFLEWENSQTFDWTMASITILNELHKGMVLMEKSYEMFAILFCWKNMSRNQVEASES